MGQQDTRGDLSDVGGLSAHVRPRYYVDGGLAGHHDTVIADTVGRVLVLDQRVSRLNELQCALLIHLWLAVLLAAAHLSKGRQHV